MHRKGFTLIELLVVISIVALLASIVLASLNTARDRGRVGSARYFATQVDHVAGDYAVGIWDFDECSSAPKDTSGNGGVATLIGGASYSSTDTPNGAGCSLNLALTQGLSIADKDSLDIGLGSATRAMWFKTTQSVGGAGLFRKSDSSNTGGMMMYLSSTGQFKCDVSSAPIILLTSNSSGYNNGAWHYGVCVLDRTTNLLTIYVDGTFQGKADASAISAVDLSATSVVWSPSGYLDLVGKIDGLHMFNKALTASEVGKLYASEKSLIDFAAK